MEIGVTLRNMGPQSTADIMRQAAQFAEQVGFESIWITDHIAIPPDDAEGSGGRYTDTLTTLAWLAGVTTTIGLGAGVLILPYRPPLPTAKQIATVQELSAERLLLGVGVGWMDAEFRALGVDRHSRGRETDARLEFLQQCFSQEVVTANGQPFIFQPRPRIPPIYVGGRAPHALERALRFGVGWMPMVRSPEKLTGDLKTLHAMADAQEKRAPAVTVMTQLPVQTEPQQAMTWLEAYQQAGVDRLVCTVGYQTFDDYRRGLEQLAQHVIHTG